MALRGTADNLVRTGRNGETVHRDKVWVRVVVVGEERGTRK
jgi:hypothetical protein